METEKKSALQIMMDACQAATNEPNLAAAKNLARQCLTRRDEDIPGLEAAVVLGPLVRAAAVISGLAGEFPYTITQFALEQFGVPAIKEALRTYNEAYPSCDWQIHLTGCGCGYPPPICKKAKPIITSAEWRKADARRSDSDREETELLAALIAAVGDGDDDDDDGGDGETTGDDGTSQPDTPTEPPPAGTPTDPDAA